MKLFKILLLSFILWGCEARTNCCTRIKRRGYCRKQFLFKVWYNEVKEQPVKLVYTSTDRPKNVDRGSMNFYKESDYHTSDNADLLCKRMG